MPNGWSRRVICQWSVLAVANARCRKQVALLVLDFDGVMTDDRVWVDQDGREIGGGQPS